MVTYARVSSERQGSHGKSLVSQSQKFASWCERGGHVIVRSYEERQSATTTVRRRLFNAMLDELGDTQPEMIAVDSADRFSRNLEDVFDVMKRLRERGINIWPLEWERDDPPDIITYDSPDYLRFREEIIAAQAEAKRIRTRILRSIAARRERGVTVTSRPTFGMRREGEQIVPSEDAWIIGEMDARLLSGEPIESVAAWVRTTSPRAWKDRQGLWAALSSPNYVKAGIRTPQQQAAIDAFKERRRARFGQRRKYEHEFAGVFACGRCLAAGVPEREALMGSFNAYRVRAAGARIPTIACRRGHPQISFVVAPLGDAVASFLDDLHVDAAALARWAAGAQTGDADAKRRDLNRALARLDQDEATLRDRRARAFDLLGDKEPALVAQARRALVEIEAEDRTIAPRRDVIRAELAKLVVPARNPVWLQGELRRFRREYARWTVGERNLWNRLLCTAIGGHPVVERDAASCWATTRITWPAVSDRVILHSGRHAERKKRRRRARPSAPPRSMEHVATD